MRQYLLRSFLAVTAITISLITFSLAAISADAQRSDGSHLVTDGAQDRLAALNERFGIDTPWRQARDEAIDPNDYECDDETDFRVWLGETVAVINPDTLAFLGGVAAFDWPTYYSLLFNNDATDDYIGLHGEYTKELIKRHKDNQRFWDVPSDDILLLGMHGAVIADDAKMVPVVQLLLGGFDQNGNFVYLPEDFAQFIVDYVQFAIESDPTIGYDHPLFTLNALAFSDEGVEIIPGFGLIPDKIVMGEGLLEALDQIGLGTNAPDYIHAHEFTHHVQYELGAFDDIYTPETTRRTELMADAFGAYYLGHARGATFQTKRFIDVLNAAYGIGDCAFFDPNHHGTPNQRQAAAIWGADLAASARKQGHINSATLMLELFEEELPNLVAPW
jgi:hypothetical protein